MSLSDLSKDILFNAQKEQDKIFESFRKERKSLEEEFEFNLKDYREKLSNRYETDYSFESKKIISLYNKKSRQLILDTKKKIIAKIKEEFLFELLSLGSKQREDLIKVLIKKAKSILKFEKVYCNKKDSKIIKNLLPKILVSNTLKINGMIFESQNGKEILDLSYESLLAEIFENKEDKIQNILFSN